MQIKYEVRPGESIHAVAQQMVKLASESNACVTTQFNEIEVLANVGDGADVVVKLYMDECQRRHDVYVSSPEYKEHQRAQEVAAENRDRLLKGALSTAPEHLTLSDADAWAETVAKNTDPYGAAVVRYAETWARLMEGRIAHGDTVEGCAKEASHIADNEGITGFMYGCAVSILAKVWIHGEALRRWHNVEMQIGDEGERANANGGVLNPAILSIEV